MKGDALKVSIAFCTAALIPGLGFCAIDLISKFKYLSVPDYSFSFNSTLIIFVFSFVIALTHAIVLGLPAYFIVQKYKINTWWMSLITGFLIGATPLGIFSFPINHPGNGFSYGGSSGYYQINGTTTAAGWISYFHSLAFWGCLGSVCAFTAWLVWRSLQKKQTSVEHKSST